MAPKHSLDAPTSSSSAVKRVRTATAPIVKKSHRANFNRLCALHNWNPSEAVRDKLAHLLQLSGNRLRDSELLPLAFVQHYPFIWVKDLLLLGYNEANDSVWYKAFPADKRMARGRYYNSAQENILGKHTVAKFWQSWVDVFDIEQRGLDRAHEFFTGVYLILKKFPNLRYKPGRGKGVSRDPQNATRLTGVPEYPFNDDHPYMQEKSSGTNDVENNEEEENLGAGENSVHEEQDDTSYIKEERTGSHDDEDRSSLLPRPLLTQYGSRAVSRETNLPSQSNVHAGDEQAGLYDPENSLAPLPGKILMKNTPRANSRDSDLIPPSHSRGHAEDNRTGMHKKQAGLVSLPHKSPAQTTSRANSRDLDFVSPSHSHGHAANDQAGLHENQDSLISLPRHSSMQPNLRAHSRKSDSTILSQSNEHVAEKRAGSHDQEDGLGSLSFQPSAGSASRAVSRPSKTSRFLQSNIQTTKARAGLYGEAIKSFLLPSQPSRPSASRALSHTSDIRTKNSENIPELPRRDATISRDFVDYTIRVPVNKPRWSNTNFTFAFAAPVYTVPEAPRNDTERRK